MDRRTSQTKVAGPATSRCWRVGNVYNLDSCERLVWRTSNSSNGSFSLNSRSDSKLEDILRMSLRILLFVVTTVSSKASFANRVKLGSRFVVEGRKLPSKLSTESGCRFVEPERWRREMSFRNEFKRTSLDFLTEHISSVEIGEGVMRWRRKKFSFAM